MRSFKSLLIPLIIMVLLVIGVIVYFVVSSSSGTNESLPTENVNAFIAQTKLLDTITVSSKEPSSPNVCVKIENANDFSFNASYEGEDKDPDASYSSSKLTDYVSSMSLFSGTLISSGMSLAEYGLDDPLYTVTYNYTTGESHTVNIGNPTPDGLSCYINVDGGSSVYAVPFLKAQYAGYTGIDFIESRILDLDYINIRTIRFQRTSDDLDITCDVDYDKMSETAAFHVVEPFIIDASENFATLVGYVAKLEITSFVEDINPDNIRSYGLDKPAFTFVFTNNDGSSVEVDLSSNMAGYYYGNIKGSSDYFKVSDSKIKLLEAPVLSLLEPYVAYYTASELSSVKGSYKDNEFVFALDVGDTEAISDDGADVMLDGRNAKIFNSEGRSYCAMFFESLACMDIGGIDLGARPEYKDPVCSLSFISRDYNTKKIDFVARTSDSYHVFVNGEYSGFYVFDKVLFNNGGQDTYSYGVWEAYKLLNDAISNNINGVYDIP